MGDGSFALSPWGILREFADQMRYYLDPEPPPPFPVVVEKLLSLWAEQHDDMAVHHDGDFFRSWEDPEIDPAYEYRYMEDRARKIRSWLASGDTNEGGDCRANPSAFVIARHDPAPNPLAEARTGGQSWPRDWKEPQMHWRDRVWHLAKLGLPLPDTLNCALLDLAQWLLGVEFYDADDREEQVHRLLEAFCTSRHNGQSDRLQGVGDIASISKDICKEIHSVVEKAHEEIEKETFVMMRVRTYRTPLRVAYLLTGEGEANLYSPAAACNFSRHGKNTTALPLSVAVSLASERFGEIELDLEAMLESGKLDQPLPDSIEERITKRGKALVFLRRVGNYLSSRGGVARIHHTKLSKFAEVEAVDRKALCRYKAAGIRANLFYESDGYVVGDRSIQYSLTEEARNLIRPDVGARDDRPDVGARDDRPDVGARDDRDEARILGGTSSPFAP